MFGWFKKQYLIVVQLDSTKEAEMVADEEGFGAARIDQYTEDLYRNNKVQMTLPPKTTYFGAIRKSMIYSKKGILHCIKKKPYD